MSNTEQDYLDFMKSSGIFVLGFMTEDAASHVSCSSNPVLQGPRVILVIQKTFP